MQSSISPLGPGHFSNDRGRQSSIYPLVLIVFMTTNHLDTIAPALKRPGRVDLCMEFGYPTRDELKLALSNIVPQFNHEHEKFLDEYGNGLNIARLQKHLFNYIIGEKGTILYQPYD